MEEKFSKKIVINKKKRDNQSTPIYKFMLIIATSNKLEIYFGSNFD